jgi:hypothetical protein
MPRTVYHVRGHAYASDAALTRAWKTLAPALHEPVHTTRSAQDDGEQVWLEDETRKWYIEAAYFTPYRRARAKLEDLDSALRNTRVYVARGDWLNGKPNYARFRCVFFVHPDGSEVALSADAKDKWDNARRSINADLRQAIDDQIRDFRVVNKLIADGKVDGKPKKLRCGVCHGCLDGETHVDHGTGDKSFASLAAQFLRTVVPAGAPDGIYSKQVAAVLDEHIPRWQKFHLRNAKLQLTHAACNLANK